ncbi:tRNA (guanosine(37)-N1)-methyltransferase TrmD [Candidatus Dojkabacteria bacterium]|uniref:tRNA (guanine-N(1)-)-methyltransferase n=1 Tax=Candidatus Dojkabacteria bacterium TaxID=2099670 RepID=A0A955LA08_9BACT|nr:tRNA (guanosine(37)-N1)-methyltransferase TrmD [Candidatus Dojkabacteria bacterium]
MNIDIITLFPGMYDGFLSESIIKKALDKKLFTITLHNLRDWGTGSYKQVDDTPFGGGAGMVLMAEPIQACLDELRTNESYVIALTAKGTQFTQSKAKIFSKKQHIILLAGHYEGFDQRVLDFMVDESISIGNYVLTGGELPSMVVSDAIVRLLPGVLGNENSPITDSFYTDDTTRQHPQYTRPSLLELTDGREISVPDVLLSGHHQNIERWRLENTKE